MLVEVVDRGEDIVVGEPIVEVEGNDDVVVVRFEKLAGIPGPEASLISGDYCVAWRVFGEEFRFVSGAVGGVVVNDDVSEVGVVLVEDACEAFVNILGA